MAEDEASPIVTRLHLASLGEAAREARGQSKGLRAHCAILLAEGKRLRARSVELRSRKPRPKERPGPRDRAGS